MARGAEPWGLRSLGWFWVLGGMLAGGVAVWVFMSSQAAWRAHLGAAYSAGLALHDTIITGAALPLGLTQTLLPPGGQPGLPAGWRETRVTLTNGRPVTAQGARLSLRIQSPDIGYPVSRVQSVGGSSQAAALASLTRTLAGFCSDPRVYVQLDDEAWRRIDGTPVWGCAAAPPDRRLWAVLIVVAALAVLLGWVSEVSAAFTTFAAALRDPRARTAQLPVGGPSELRRTAEAVNTYVAQDRAALANRAMVLSGVSHDLGTPATRLRLRSALIEDDTLRARLEHDIDEMTGMIDGVLTYTRAEIGSEPFRRLSLTSLAEAVVADYQDVGMPVTLTLAPPRRAGAATLFSGRWAAAPAARAAAPTTVEYGGGDAEGNRHRDAAGPAPGAQPLLMRGQPTALRRALSNLIDNALKYGRAARVHVDGDADEAWITVTDRGSALTEQDLERLTGAFQRGGNAGGAPGVGLGLAIVATIAAQHGGRVTFDRAADGRAQGLAARLILCRNWA